MARRGRKRKNGHRSANGNIKQPNAAQRHKTAQDLIDIEKSVVLAQPHRRGDRNQLCESPLGRLVLRRKLSLVIYDAALEYGRRLRRWLTQRGVEIEIHPPSVAYSGMGVEAATMRKWGVEIDRVDTALKKISVDGFNAVRMLTVAEREIAPDVEEAAVACLEEVAIQLSMLRRVAPPAAKPPTQRHDEAPQSEAAPDKFIRSQPSAFRGALSRAIRIGFSASRFAR
jgi:hypothetical protein